MKFKKDKMIRLSPQVVADYLRTHHWRHERDVESKGAIWLYRDDQGHEHEIMLPTNREMGDYAIRMSEAIYTLGEVERRDLRDVYLTLAETGALPSDIFEGEIAAEEGLRWNADEKAKLEPFMETLDQNCIAAEREMFLACLAEIAERLGAGTALIGDATSKQAAVWRSCKRALLAAGWQAKGDVSGTEFWNAALAGMAGDWFTDNFLPGDELGKKKPRTAAPRDLE